MNIYYYKVIKLNIIEFWKNILTMTVSFVIPVGIILIIMYYTNFNGIWNILVYESVYTLLFCIVSYFVTMNEYEKDIIDSLLVKLHIRKLLFKKK